MMIFNIVYASFLIISSNCTDTLVRYASKSQPDVSRFGFADSISIWNSKIFWSATSHLFDKRLSAREYPSPLSSAQSRYMIYLSEHCHLMSWIESLPPIEQEWYLPYVPDSILDANWAYVKDGVGRTSSSWRKRIVTNHHDELATYAKPNGYVSNGRLMKLIGSPEYAKSLRDAIENMLKKGYIEHSDVGPIMAQINSIRTFGDSTIYGQALASVWISRDLINSQNCPTPIAGVVLSFIAPKEVPLSRKINSLVDKASMHPIDKPNAIIVRQIDSLVDAVFLERFNLRIISNHAVVSCTCRH